MIEKILERLEECKNRYTNMHIIANQVECPNMGMLYAERIEMCEDAIRIVQEVAKEYGNGWIPCSERLPEYMEEVLVWHSDQNMHCVAWYNPSTKIWYSNDFTTEDSKYIVAWCELPAPYQKGE